MKIVCIGGGSWGTALAQVVASKGIPTTLFVRSTSLATSIMETHYNERYFPEYKLSPYITATTDAEEAFNNATIILYSASFQHARTIISANKQFFPKSAIFVNASKGIEEDSLLSMSQVIQEMLPQHAEHFSVLSGPSFAKEVLENKVTTVIIASKNLKISEYIQQIFSTAFFRLYSSTDVIGVEIAGAAKNSIAIATGIVDSVEQSYNTRATIITRGLAEITRLGMVLGAQQHTFMGLAGIGDLMLTCTGNLSRNWHVGVELGKGNALTSILNSMETVAEGVYTTNAVYELAKRHTIYMPIVDALHALLHNTCSVNDIRQLFSTRELKSEYDF